MIIFVVAESAGGRAGQHGCAMRGAPAGAGT